jgi:hypothetical protein
MLIFSCKKGIFDTMPILENIIFYHFFNRCKFQEQVVVFGYSQQSVNGSYRQIQRL